MSTKKKAVTPAPFLNLSLFKNLLKAPKGHAVGGGPLQGGPAPVVFNINDYQIKLFHSSKHFEYLSTFPLFSKDINKKLDDTLDKKYIEHFWLGLLEGDGTITVDLHKSLQPRIRFVIALLDIPENRIMLYKIQSVIGGRVGLENKKNIFYVLWIASSLKDNNKILKILSKYKLLTSRKIAQLEFAKSCLINSNFNGDLLARTAACPRRTKREFLAKRDKKYIDYAYLYHNNPLDFRNISYFNGWLSGFIEAEGNFSLILRDSGKIHKAGFSIGQNSDKYILETIKNFFDSHQTITQDKRVYGLYKHYRISIYGPKSRLAFFNHFAKYPLLGAKNKSYQEWISYFKLGTTPA